VTYVFLLCLVSRTSSEDLAGFCFGDVRFSPHLVSHELGQDLGGLAKDHSRDEAHRGSHLVPVDLSER
jgi:hypothetical protein